MALLPYKSDKNSFRRNNSLPLFVPIKKEVIHNEIRSFNKSTLLRSFGYTKIFFKDDNGVTFKTTQTKVMSVLIPSKKFRENNIQAVGETGGEPSIGLTKLMEQPQTTDHDSNSSNFTDKKKTSKPKARSNWNYRIKWHFSILVIVIAIWIYSPFWKYFYKWNFEKVSSNLSNNVFGQNEAIEKLNSTLALINKTNGLHVVVFTGSVGVGKTFTSNILSQSLPWASNKLIVEYSDGISIAEKLPDTFSNFGYNFVRVDNLTPNDVDQVIIFVKVLKNQNKGEKVLLLLIFTTHCKEEEKKVLSSFKSSHLPIVFIPFKNLTQDAVKKCYKFEIKKQKAQISEAELNKLIHNKMKIIDISKGSVGCKGVTQDVSYYLKKKN